VSRGNDNYVRVRGVDLWVRDRGRGRPLIALHGGPGRDHWEFGGLLDPLAADLRLVLIDQRGHGRSSPAPSETLTLRDLALDIAALAEALECEDYVVLGHSFGGFVALQVAIDSAPRLGGVVLACTLPSLRWLPPLGERLAGLPESIRVELAAAIGAEQHSVEEMTLAADAQLPFAFADPYDPRIADYRRRIARRVLRPEVRTIMRASGYDAAMAYDEELHRVRVPALVLAGAHDRVCPSNASVFMSEQIPDAELVLFRSSGHLPFVEEPKPFLGAIRRFVIAG
jgi:proline iminopeptidase